MHKPLDLKVVKRILKYLQNTLDHGLVFTTTSKLCLVGFSNTNWGMDVDDRRLTIYFFMFLGGNQCHRALKSNKLFLHLQ